MASVSLSTNESTTQSHPGMEIQRTQALQAPADCLLAESSSSALVALNQQVQGVTTHNGDFVQAGGNVSIQRNYYNAGEPTFSIENALRHVLNFRKVHLGVLSKATPGTVVWLLKTDKFLLWLDLNGDLKIFWGYGIPGAGKTVMASIVIKRLEALRRGSDAAICVCYVYFRYSDRSEVTVRNVLEILVKQTLERHPECRALIERTYAQHIHEESEPTEEELLGLLRELAGHMACTFYVLDALDEAPTRIQLVIVKKLASLNIKLFITSRPLKAVEANFPEAYSFPITAQDGDIDLHIAKGLAESADLQNLIRQIGPSLREEIASTIKRNCGGMFLHASLQLDALAECVSVHAVRRMLQAFPSRIEDVYLQTWDRILKQDADNVSLAKAVLVWVLNASRSMTIEELERAVAACPDTYKFEPDRRVPSTTLMSLCRGLVIVEEESHLVRLVHYTAKDTLQGLLSPLFPYPHSLLAAVCMTHLANCAFQNTTIASRGEFETTLRKDPLLTYASEAWVFHTRESMLIDDGRERASQFVTRSNAFPALTSVDRSAFFDILTPLHIVALYHLPLVLIKDIILGDPNVTTRIHRRSPLVIACQFGHEGLVANLTTLSDIQVNLVETNGWSGLMMAARHGHEGTVKLLLERPDIQVNLVKTDGWSALMMAVKYGHEGSVKLLLAHPDIQVNPVDTNGRSALMLAARYGHEGSVKLLLERPNIQVNLVDADGWSALVMAARYGHEGAVKLLLERPDIQVNLVKTNGLSALVMAAMYGHEGSIKLLLERPDIQVNLVNADAWSALVMAARYGHEGSIKLLLEHSDIQVNLVDADGWSALMMAARYGHEGSIKLLLERPDIQVNLVDADGWSAVIMAARYGHEGSIRLLLEHPDIQVNLVDADGWSALMMAARYGHEGTVKLLLERPDIQVNPVNADGWSALVMVSRYGHEGTVKLLLERPDIQVNLVDANGWSALALAAGAGHHGIAKLLLMHPDIQVNLVDADRWSALMQAARYGHEGSIKLLLERPDIQVNLVDADGWSALVMAARYGHEGSIKLLLERPDIQVNLVDTDGWPALMMAARYGHEGSVKLLLERPDIQVNLVDANGWSALTLAAGAGHHGIVKLIQTFKSTW